MPMTKQRWRSEQVRHVRGRKALLDMRKPRCNSRAIRIRYAGDCKALRGMSFDATASKRLIPASEKQFHRLPADGFFYAVP